MSYISAPLPGAKGLGISVLDVSESKSLPRSPKEKSSSTREPRSCLHTLYRYECDTWAWEIFNIVLSLAALATVIIALRYYDGKAAPEWPYSLTLNAFVSVCMMIMGAALTVPVSNGTGQLKWLMARKGNVSVVALDTLDRASRGMWGSVCAIFTWSGGLIGSLGALITIVAFAASPFVQQALSIQQGLVETKNDTFARLGSCGAETFLQQICTGSSLSGAAAKTFNVAPTLLRGQYYSAVYSTYNQSVAAHGLASCPSGNCTWEPFTTLSVCNQCIDVSQFLVREASVSETGEVVSLPGGPSIDTTFDTFDIARTDPSSRIETTNVTAYTFGVLEAKPDGQVSGLECKLDFCVQLIEAELAGGVYKETILRNFTEYAVMVGDRTAALNLDRWFQFNDLTDATGRPQPAISVDEIEPQCLGSLLSFEPKEVLALTELGLDSIPSMVDDLAISVARSVRTICENGTRILGSSWREVSLVRIDWWWVLLPIVVEALGIGFFVWVAVWNKMAAGSIWKSSLIATLFHSLHSKELDGGDSLESLYEMEKVAEKMSTRLSAGTRTYRSRLVQEQK